MTMISRKLEAYATEKPDSYLSNGAERQPHGGAAGEETRGGLPRVDQSCKSTTRQSRVLLLMAMFLHVPLLPTSPLGCSRHQRTVADPRGPAPANNLSDNADRVPRTVRRRGRSARGQQPVCTAPADPRRRGAGSLLRGRPPMPLHRCPFDPERTMGQADSAAAAPERRSPWPAATSRRPSVAMDGTPEIHPKRSLFGPAALQLASVCRTRTKRLEAGSGELSSK